MISEHFGFRFALYALFLIFNMLSLSPIVLVLSTINLIFFHFFVNTLRAGQCLLVLFVCVILLTVPPVGGYSPVSRLRFTRQALEKIDNLDHTDPEVF